MSFITRRTVVSEPGAVVTCVRIELSDEWKAAVAFNMQQGKAQRASLWRKVVEAIRRWAR